MSDRDDAIRAAMQQASDADRTADGKPKMAYLNDALEAAGFDAITAEERDRFWNEPSHDDAATGAEPVAADAETVGRTGRTDDEPEMVAANAAVPQPAGQEVPLRNASMHPADASRVEATAAAPPVVEPSDADDADADDTAAAPGTVRIKLLRAPADPLPLYVHGVGRFSLPVGEEKRIPAEALPALRDADVSFEELDG